MKYYRHDALKWFLKELAAGIVWIGIIWGAIIAVVWMLAEAKI